MLLPHIVCNAIRVKSYNECCVALCMFRVCGSYYCVSLAMRRVECVKCAEGV